MTTDKKALNILARLVSLANNLGTVMVEKDIDTNVITVIAGNRHWHFGVPGEGLEVLVDDMFRRLPDGE